MIKPAFIAVCILSLAYPAQAKTKSALRGPANKPKVLQEVTMGVIASSIKCDLGRFAATYKKGVPKHLQKAYVTITESNQITKSASTDYVLPPLKGSVNTKNLQVRNGVGKGIQNVHIDNAKSNCGKNNIFFSGIYQCLAQQKDLYDNGGSLHCDSSVTVTTGGSVGLPAFLKIFTGPSVSGEVVGGYSFTVDIPVPN